MQQTGPVHSQRSRSSPVQFISPLLVVYLLYLGLSQGDAISLLLALLLALYFGFTFHVRYDLYLNAVVVRHLAPRQKAVPLSDIEDVRLMRVPLRGETLLIRRRNGGPLLIRPYDIEGFLSRLNEVRAGAS